MEENVIQVSDGMMINADVSVKNIIYMNKISNYATSSCKNGKYLASIIDISLIMCDEIIDAETKTIPKNFNENTKLLYFTCLFINYYSIVVSC